MNTIIFNANIYINQNERANALLIENGIVKAFGTNEYILAFKDDNTNIIDGQGNSVIPGFNDSHLHLHSVGVSLQSVELYGLTSIEDVINKARIFIEKNKVEDGKFVYGRGWNQDYFTDENRMLTRHDLDKISTRHPILFNRACGHLAVCNTKALEVCGIDEHTPQIEGAEFYYDDNGYPNGIFTENAIELIRSHIPAQTVEEMAESINIAMDYALSQGITSIQTNDLNTDNYQKMYEAYKLVYNKSLNRPKAYHQCTFFNPNDYQKFIDEGFITNSGDKYNRIGPLKVFVDGSLGARTALLRQPYYDDNTTSGITCLTQTQLNDLVKVASNNNCQVVVHGIGDLAIEMILDAYKENGNKELRNGVVHAQITDEAMIQRFVDEEVYALVQPIFIHYDMHIVEDRVGKELASTSYAFGDMYRKGVKLNYGTDSPVEDLKPFDNLYCAVTRKDLKAAPASGYYPEQGVDLNTAIMLYTNACAFNSFEENTKGNLNVGYDADLILLDKNIYEEDIENIRNTNVLMTFVQGNLSYKKV